MKVSFYRFLLLKYVYSFKNIRRDFFFRIYFENMIGTTFEEFLCKSLSFINKITIMYKISLINFTKVYDKNL